MADFVYRKTTRVRHEWAIPGATAGGHGAAVAEFYKAIASAETAYRAIFGKDPTYDDWLRFYAADDEIVLWFEEEL
jgi:hypothetical protein